MNETENESVTYQLDQQMTPEAEATARTRLVEMPDEQKHRLICLPVLGWENERILLQNEAPYSWRIAGEALATSRAVEMDRIKSALQNLRNEWDKDGALQHGGKVAAALDDSQKFVSALEEIFEELDSEKNKVADLQEELAGPIPKTFTHQEIADELGISRGRVSQIVKDLRDEGEIKSLTGERLTAHEKLKVAHRHAKGKARKQINQN
jgi:predicted transcriptional regulator